MSLPAFSVRQTVLVNVLFFVCLLGGVIAYQSTPVDFFPEIGFNVALVRTQWTGASADEVERLVTTRIEEELGELEGVKEIRSTSRANSSSIALTFEDALSDEEYDRGINDLRAAVDRVTDLPADSEEPIVTELSTKALFSDMRVAVVDVAGLGDTPLREVAADVKTRLEEVAGVERVEVRGDHDREVRVLVDRDKAARHGLSVVEIADRIRARNRIDARPLWSSIEGLELGPESLLIEAERRQQVVSALAQLPDEQAIVLELHRIDGLPHKEIAGLLGISVAASRKRLERAALSLETAIREPMPEVLPHTHIESWRHSLLRRALPERDSQ